MTKPSKSLEEIHGSIDTRGHKRSWRRLLAFMGPAYLVAVGYMDPGNWATDIAGGSRYGYQLIWILVLSAITAMVLQGLCARLGIVRRADLAQASRMAFAKPVNYVLYGLAEIAIAATDLAEVLGMAIGLQLLFGLPLMHGMIITLLDTVLLFWLIGKGVRRIESVILCLVVLIGGAFVVQLFLAKPDVGLLVNGLIPRIPDTQALYIAIGIIGATVMPHNLYLHSALVQTRSIGTDEPSVKRAIKYNFFDSTIALSLALFVNAAILILAAAAFHSNALYEVTELKDAHRLLAPILGTALAPILFAVALVASGQSSTITGTLAGQVVMEGYLGLRLRPWIRRLLTRSLAITPAIIVISMFGEGATGEMLILSQVILSLQLGFAVIPLIRLVSDKQTMGTFTIGIKTRVTAWVMALTIVSLNIWLIFKQVNGWIDLGVISGFVVAIVVGVSLALVGLLLYMTFAPLRRAPLSETDVHVPLTLPDLHVQHTYNRIAVAVDFSEADVQAMQTAAGFNNTATLVLIHVVETPTARVFGPATADAETSADLARLEAYAEHLRTAGRTVAIHLQHGSPATEIVKVVKDEQADLLVMAAHGHRSIQDFLRGATIDRVRHRAGVPVFIVPPVV